jgi:hypothetical protein
MSNKKNNSHLPSHARRPKPGSTFRYFANVGYCSSEAAEPWPAYGSMVEMGEINTSALANGLGSHGR